MPEEIDVQEIKKQYPKFFENFPKELLKVVFSEETPLQIAEICLENGIADEEKIEDVIYHITSVLLGRLPMKILPIALQANSKIDRETAEKISDEINRTIFSPVKNDLTELYKNVTPIKSATKPQKPSTILEEASKKPPKKDIYKEPVE